jgi:hypothetical protein
VLEGGFNGRRARPRFIAQASSAAETPLRAPACAPKSGPSFSKPFQGKSKPFQGNSKLFQAFSKEFQTFSLAVSNEIKSLSPAPGDFPFFVCAPEIPSRCERARRTPRDRGAIGRPGRASLAEVSLLPRFPFFRKKMSRSPRRARVRKARRGARYPRQGGRIAELAPNGSERVRWFAADFRHRPGGCNAPHRREPAAVHGRNASRMARRLAISPARNAA